VIYQLGKQLPLETFAAINALRDPFNNGNHTYYIRAIRSVDFPGVAYAFG
jgi:hypothetical protein